MAGLQFLLALILAVGASMAFVWVLQGLCREIFRDKRPGA